GLPHIFLWVFSWVTTDIFAMVWPSTDLIKRYNIIEQFKSSLGNMLTVALSWNLTVVSHTHHRYSCRARLIYFYNFGMTDFGVLSMAEILDAVKCLAFCVQKEKWLCTATLGGQDRQASHMQK
ncbi:hypothetical protein P4O66_018445, partial [Electrophorus voltai]